jgi:hypothetical protein
MQGTLSGVPTFKLAASGMVKVIAHGTSVGLP